MTMHLQVRRTALIFLAVLLVLWMPALAGVAADDKPAGDGFLGKWEKPEGDILDVITISKNGDDWSISAVYLKDGKEVGSFTGKNVKFEKGALSYVTEID
ncbi:MAG TPA: hypothetical protein VG013_27420, partial [Gemmataceae bacterium]|nr:hypothetical protein [Gemmataceae bacterium]